MLEVNFANDENHIILNPRLHSAQSILYRYVAEAVLASKNLKSHIVIQTSGTTQTDPTSFKLLLLSKEAFLASAKSVNRHLKSRSSDVWLSVLPSFHVGGLGVWARAFCSQSKVVQMKAAWSAEEFVNICLQEEVTLTSLVPTQVFDLVKLGKNCPPSVRAIVIGGGVLSVELYREARTLGYPLLPSYGMTETCSQIATASLSSLRSLNFPEVVVLDHARIDFSTEGFLKIRADSMATFVVKGSGLDSSDVQYSVESVTDEEGWLMTEDFAKAQGESFIVLGRGSDFVKISGESVNLARLRNVFESQIKQLAAIKELDFTSFALHKNADSRLGSKVVCFIERKSLQNTAFSILQEAIANFNCLVLPYERIREVISVEEIPRTELGKVLWNQLEKLDGEKHEVW